MYLVILITCVLQYNFNGTRGVVGWCDGAGETSSAGASYNLDTVGQGPTALSVGAGGGCLDIFTLVCPFSPLSPSLWETARYRLKYCLKGPLNPKQPTNQPSMARTLMARLQWLFRTCSWVPRKKPWLQIWDNLV